MSEATDKPFDAFLSHASANAASAQALCQALEALGYRCWIAPRDLRGGFSYPEEIEAGIQRCRALVLLFSGAANASPQVLREVERAVHHRLPILPVRLEPAVPTGGMAYLVGSVHWIDAFPPHTPEQFGTIRDALERRLRGEEERRPIRLDRLHWPGLGLAATTVLVLVLVARFLWFSPTWPDRTGVGVLAALVALPTLYAGAFLSRRGRKWMRIAGVVIGILCATVYLCLRGLFVYDAVPSESPLWPRPTVVGGFVLKPDASKMGDTEAEILENCAFHPEQVWQEWTISVVQVLLLLSWLGLAAGAAASVTGVPPLRRR